MSYAIAGAAVWLSTFVLSALVFGGLAVADNAVRRRRNRPTPRRVPTYLERYQDDQIMQHPDLLPILKQAEQELSQ